MEWQATHTHTHTLVLPASNIRKAALQHAMVADIVISSKKYVNTFAAPSVAPLNTSSNVAHSTTNIKKEVRPSRSWGAWDELRRRHPISPLLVTPLLITQTHAEAQGKAAFTCLFVILRKEFPSVLVWGSTWASSSWSLLDFPEATSATCPDAVPAAPRAAASAARCALAWALSAALS